MLIAAAVLLLVAGAWAALLVAYARRLAADWREPVFAEPVLVIESDDWGPGPPTDAQRLRELASELLHLRDCRANPPTVTLGVVLAVPDPSGTDRSESVPAYVRKTMEAPEFAPHRAAMLAGREAGVFALQLHGMEHFWPPALVAAAQADVVVRRILVSGANEFRHEALPPHLQARWIEAARLPSRPLSRADIAGAVAQETACFARVFDSVARVAVPVTFTWTSEVEAQWARHGVEVVVTPGTRYIGRDHAGRLIGDGSILRNGDRGAEGVVHVVRDVYFEPALGHSAEAVLAQVLERYRLGRPALIEMHRFNFTGPEEQARRSIAELVKLLRTALADVPRLRFVSTESLAQAIVSRDPSLIDPRFSARLRALVLRAATASRLRKFAWMTGLAVPAAVVLLAASAWMSLSARKVQGA